MKNMTMLAALLAVLVFVPIAATSAIAAGNVDLSLAGVVDQATDAVVVGTAEVLPDSSDVLAGLLPDWVMVVLAILYGLAHVVARLPVTLVERLPGWLRSLLDLVAANYGNAKNREEPGWLRSR